MKRRITVLVGAALLLAVGLILRSAVEAQEKWGPFRGQILDVETAQPIPGAAVLVVWWESVPNPVQMQTKFFDAREAVTAEDGRFEVPRRPPPFFTFTVLPPQISYFAAGYEPVAEIVSPPGGQPFVDPTIVKMRRLTTRQELLRKSRGHPSRVPAAKMKRFLQAINAESEMLGLPQIRIDPLD